jgi:type II secretory pathway component PulF
MEIVALCILILSLFMFLGYKRPSIAVLTVPIVCILIVYTALWLDFFEIVVFSLVLFVITLVTVLLAKREPDSEQWPQKTAKWMLISLAVVLFIVTAAAVFTSGGFDAFLPFIVFSGVLFILIGLIIGYGLTSQYTIAAYVISTIGSSMRQNLPLPMALESAAGEPRDRRSRILSAIKKWLVQGYSLSESIKRGYPKCPGYATAMIAASERIGQLPLAMASIEADMLAKADEKRKLRPVHPLYPLILVTFMFIIIFALVWKVIPTFSSVLTEMAEGTPLPSATQLLIRVTNYVWLFCFVFALIIIVIVPLAICTKLRPRRPQKQYLLSLIGDFVKWHLPVLHWFEKNYSMVQTVELLRLSLNAGCTINDAIANTLSLDVNNSFRKLLKRWLAKVEAGDNIADAAKESGLSSTLAWAFDDKVNQGNTLSILETLESFYRSNYSYYINLARFIMWPCVTIAMGAMVGFVVFAIFSPGVAIIHNMVELVYP